MSRIRLIKSASRKNAWVEPGSVPVIGRCMMGVPAVRTPAGSVAVMPSDTNRISLRPSRMLPMNTQAEVRARMVSSFLICSITSGGAFAYCCS
jgi:hypothetical protein